MWTGAYLCGRVWPGPKKRSFFKILIYQSPVRRTAQSALQSALHVMLLGICVFHERQRDICRRRAYLQGFVKAEHMSYDRQHFDPA